MRETIFPPWLVTLVMGVCGSGFLTVPCTAFARAAHRSAPVAMGESAEATELTYLGFIHDAAHPQIHVRTGEKTTARLEILGPLHAALHLPHAQITKHVMGLPLDTRCFGGAVQTIEPAPQEEPDEGTVIHIRLRQRTHLQMIQRDNDVFVTLSPLRPSRGRAARHK